MDFEVVSVYSAAFSRRNLVTRRKGVGISLEAALASPAVNFVKSSCDATSGVILTLSIVPIRKEIAISLSAAVAMSNINSHDPFCSQIWVVDHVIEL